MRLAYLVELVVTCAVGLVLARWEVGDLQVIGGGMSRRALEEAWWSRGQSGFAVGVGLAGLVGLMVEVARRRSPRPWGLGRWTWSVVGLWLVGHPAFSLSVHAAAYLFSGMGTGSQFLTLVPDNLRAMLQMSALPPLACLVLALAITRRIAAPGPVATDAREWAGRGFALLAVILSLWSNALVMISIFG